MFNFPDWLHEFQIQDEMFAEAYEATLPQKRAWLKKTIAQVFAVNSPDAPQKTWNVMSWRGGFETEISRGPLDWVVMLLDEGSTSPVRILAALTPALAAGIKNILVVYCGEMPIVQSVLTAFELAGQEDVVHLPKNNVIELLEELYSSESRGAVLDLRLNPDQPAYSDSVRYWRAPHISSISVCKDDESPDMEILKFAHPDVRFEAVSHEDLDEAAGIAIVVPAEFVGDVLTSFSIVLTHGQEGCWVWNDLSRDFFMRESVALAVAE